MICSRYNPAGVGAVEAPKMFRAFLFMATCSHACTGMQAQEVDAFMSADDLHVKGDVGDDPLPSLNAYERFNWLVGGIPFAFAGAIPVRAGWRIGTPTGA